MKFSSHGGIVAVTCRLVPKGDSPLAVDTVRIDVADQGIGIASDELQRSLPAPDDWATFERCRLDWDEWETNVEHRRLHADLIAIRGQHRAFNQQAPGAVEVEAGQVDPSGRPPLVEEDRRDQVAADDEEDLDTEEPAGQPLIVGVVDHHRHDGERAHAVESR